MNVPGYQRQFAQPDGQTRVPIGAFLIPGDVTTLIDAGAGPLTYGSLQSGALLDELALAGVQPADVDTLALTHLHFDHDGWIAGADGKPTFPNATIHVSAEDYDHFVVNPDPADAPPIPGTSTAAAGIARVGGRGPDRPDRGRGTDRSWRHSDRNTRPQSGARRLRGARRRRGAARSRRRDVLRRAARRPAALLDARRRPRGRRTDEGADQNAGPEAGDAGHRCAFCRPATCTLSATDHR